jgi:hypothetical protein
LDLDAYIDSAAAMVDLPVAAEHRPGVRRFLALAAAMAATLDRVPLDEDELALAPVFTLPELRE